MSITHTLRQIVRGCGPLPHVGEHPGTTMFLGFIVIGAIARSKDGAFAAMGGAAMMTICIGPFYLYGAYDRANLSDHIEATGGQS